MIIQHSLVTAESIWEDVLRIRSSAPLVHNITNYVVMEFTANVLLALGASPVMAHAREEVAEMCGIAKSLVVNIGTLSEPWVASMNEAFAMAKKKNIPIVLDPVGAGATQYRTEVAKDFINRWHPTVIRGNASEIAAVANHVGAVVTKGVDSTLRSDSVIESAQKLSKETGSVVVVSGELDYIIDNEQIAVVNNGYALMPKVIGMGCSATAIIGAFLGVNLNAFSAATHAMSFIAIAGELASKQASAPGSYKTFFIDALYEMDLRNLSSHLNLEIL